MTTTKERHPRCGGEWVGPVQADEDPVDVCTACGGQRAAGTPPPTG